MRYRVGNKIFLLPEGIAGGYRRKVSPEGVVRGGSLSLTRSFCRQRQFVVLGGQFVVAHIVSFYHRGDVVFSCDYRD